MNNNVAVTEVNPINDKLWNEKMLMSGVSTIFHSANWARLLISTYGYRPRYFVISDINTFRGCLPMIEVRSLITGRRGVSLSFTDYCTAVVKNDDEFSLLLNAVLEVGKRLQWQYAEFRGEPHLSEQIPAKIYAHHQIELSTDEQMKSRLRDSTARNIKKAIKEGVCVETSQSLQAVRQFYNLHCITRKRQGLPPQPKYYFDNLHKYIISDGLGFTALAKHHGITVAAMICLFFGKNAIYKYGASNQDYQNLRANNLLLWDSMRMCARQGCDYFSLGRTDLENEGLLAFKNGWGSYSTTINYYRYDFGENGFVASNYREPESYRKALKNLPLCLLRALGNVAYRHIG